MEEGKGKRENKSTNLHEQIPMLGAVEFQVISFSSRFPTRLQYRRLIPSTHCLRQVWCRTVSSCK